MNHAENELRENTGYCVECPQCSGDGHIEVRLMASDNVESEIWGCDLCNSSGLIYPHTYSDYQSAIVDIRTQEANGGVCK